MRLLLILVLLGFTVWLAVERRNLSDRNAQLEAKLGSATRQKDDALRKLPALEDRIAAFESKTSELAARVAQSNAAPPPTPPPVPPPPAPVPEKKTWLQERIENGNSLEAPPRPAYDRPYNPRPATPGSRIIR
jgi:hypothetical protein